MRRIAGREIIIGFAKDAAPIEIEADIPSAHATVLVNELDHIADGQGGSGFVGVKLGGKGLFESGKCFGPG